ncbi:helix-turn-helix transcriptional regulator [Cetobacterium somerae]|uniref:helix-turn-helix domain-containing protein n=1 Tax=Cetobacterium somerae TaxID=188913 RepID=UPI00211F357C|nr:helix-turn-helix transcriptional regulator [Cetobacterium somerae]MCQ9627806.1 helix-turn-helix transcriptional regulator [Cetobacterium somerae]
MIYLKIIKEINSQGLTYVQIIKKLGMKKSTFYDQLSYLKNGKFPSIEMLMQIQEVLGIELIRFDI